MAMEAQRKREAMETTAEGAPVTKQRMVEPREFEKISKPCFRIIGFNFVLAFMAMVVIHGSMSYATLESWIPSPLFPIYIKNIHKAKHGSDSGVYDHEGRFVPANFELLFEKYARTHPDRMSFKEIIAMTEGQRDAFDLFGWTANKLEWSAAYWILGDEKGYMSKDTIRAVYDGSVFEFIEKHRAQKNKLF